MRALLVLVLFAFVGILAAGSGYVKVQQAERQRDRSELGLLKKEKLIVLDMLKERDEELQLYKEKLSEASEESNKSSEQVKKHKAAAKKLAEMLSKTQKERDAIKVERDDLSKPDSMPCAEAIQTKDRAIAALIEERHASDQQIERMKKDLQRFEKKADSAVATLSEKEVEVDELLTWKEKASVELKQCENTARSKSIWAASVEGSSKSCPTCPAPVPALSTVEELGDILEKGKLGVGLELGCAETKDSVNLVTKWTAMKNFYCITEPEATPAATGDGNDEEEHEEDQAETEKAAIRKSMTQFGQKMNFIHDFKHVMVKQFADDSLDLLHFAYSFKHEFYSDVDKVETVLEKFWPKMKQGGMIVGGIVGDNKVKNSEKDTLLAGIQEFALSKDRQLARFGPNVWAIRA